jgi:hypothetical protein
MRIDLFNVLHVSLLITTDLAYRLPQPVLDSWNSGTPRLAVDPLERLLPILDNNQMI